MQAELLGHLIHGQGTDRRRSLAQKAPLAGEDRPPHTLEGAQALADRFDDPAGALQAPAQVLAQLARLVGIAGQALDARIEGDLRNPAAVAVQLETIPHGLHEQVRLEDRGGLVAPAGQGVGAQVREAPQQAFEGLQVDPHGLGDLGALVAFEGRQVGLDQIGQELVIGLPGIELQQQGLARRAAPQSAGLQPLQVRHGQPERLRRARQAARLRQEQQLLIRHRQQSPLVEAGDQETQPALPLRAELEPGNLFEQGRG